jgi:protoheme IX farnesyltransferase
MSLGLASLVLYVFCYTPLKQKTWMALIIGSIPGAMPVALGYISLANKVDVKVVALFFWAFLWQIPHFLAISLFREHEYTQAGFPVLSERWGIYVAKWVLLGTSWLLVASTFGLYLTGMISLMPLFLCLFLGVFFLVVCHRGSFSDSTDRWARRAFKASLVYQGLLFLVLIAAAF